MGIYDREYYQDERGGSFLGRGPSAGVGGMPITIRLIIINSVVFLVTIFLDVETRIRMVTLLGVTDETLRQPWMWWQMLTYGFVHDPNNVFHLIFNMVGLFFFGRAVEERLGRGEFLRFYLGAVLVGGLVSAVHYGALITDRPMVVIGASGAVSAAVLLAAFYYPRAMALLFVIPMPLWVLAALMIVFNVLGSLRQAAGHAVGHTAYDVHLAGLAFAAAYYYLGWNTTRLWQGISGFWSRRRPGRPKLRVLRGEDDEKLAKEADRILDKLHREGADSLTAKERKILENYSRKVRKKKGR